MDKPTPHSKILTIINEDYMKMMSKEQESKTISKSLPPKKNLTIKKKISGYFLTRKTKRLQMPKAITVKSEKPEEKAELSEKKQRWKNLFKERNKILWWNPPEKSLAFDFCSDTSLHGLKYIGQQNRHISERIFWMLAFICGLSVAVVLISDVWNKYRNSPIIVSFSPTPINVDQVPFPAVTICNMNKVLKSKAHEYVQRALNDESDEAQADVYYLYNVCSATRSFTKQFNLTREGDDLAPIIKRIVDKVNKNPELVKSLNEVNTFLRKASQNCSDMIPLCIWQDREVKDCSTLFHPIETEFGKCCTFNMIPQSELYKQRNDSRDDENEIIEWKKWNFDSMSEADGILLIDYKGNYPRRQMEPGKSFGLSVLLNPSIDEYFCTTSDSQGFRMSTHWPTDVPHVTDFGTSIRSKSEVFVNVQPEITLVDSTIYSFDLSVRQCYKSGEFPLEYFNYYTSRNCVDECIANETIKMCGCKRYFMPRSSNQTLCGGDFDCAEEVKLNMTKFGSRTECKQCLPGCSEIEYMSQTTTTPLQDGIWVYSNGEAFSRQVNQNVTIAHIFFGQDATYARVRNELFGSTDLLSNTGGLMGLCLGFSGLSLMEVIYFFTLRAWWASKRKDGLRIKIGRKVKSAWGKVKAVKLFQYNKESILNKQPDEDIIIAKEEKDDDPPLIIYPKPEIIVEQVIAENSNEEEKDISRIASPRNCSPTPPTSLKAWEKELGKVGAINKKINVSAPRYKSILGDI